MVNQELGQIEMGIDLIEQGNTNTCQVGMISVRNEMSSDEHTHQYTVLLYVGVKLERSGILYNTWRPNIDIVE